jgi:ubiquinone/menaquinone biosynthesis C-methylase UbiE
MTDDIRAMESGVANHYTQADLLSAIEQGVRQLGKTPQTVTMDELAPVDEFHIGGRVATVEFLKKLGLTQKHRVLDVGCGFGGTSRFAASQYGCKVTGIDLTPEFVRTGRVLCSWVGMDARVELHEGSALAMPFADAEFDSAYMLHVGMNIADKVGLMQEVFRVLKPGGLFGVYDVMLLGANDLIYPVPWATASHQSALSTKDEYESAFNSAGFAIEATRDRSEFAAKFFEDARKRVESATGTDGSIKPALGVHLAMGDNAEQKIKNMVANIQAGLVGPIEIVARK